MLCFCLCLLQLSIIRLLASMISDVEIAALLLEYARTVDAESFSHRANGVVYHQYGFLSEAECDTRERLFAFADELLYEMMRMVNNMRLRGEIEVEMRELVKLRTRRRATLDTGFPMQYFWIVFALGASIVFSFLLLLVGNPAWIELPIVSVLFSILLTVLVCLAAVIADLRDPFIGNYRLGRGRMARTLSLLNDVTEHFKGEAGPGF